MHPTVGFLPLQNLTFQEVGVQVMLVTITAKSVTPNLSATLIRQQRHFTPERTESNFSARAFFNIQILVRTIWVPVCHPSMRLLKEVIGFETSFFFSILVVEMNKL